MFNNSKSGTTQYAGYDKRFAQPERNFIEGKLLDAGTANVISIGAADTAIIQAVGEGSSGKTHKCFTMGKYFYARKGFTCKGRFYWYRRYNLRSRRSLSQ